MVTELEVTAAHRSHNFSDILNCRSCQIFQEFSNSLAHIVRAHTQQELDWYLDDYFFADICRNNCDWQVTIFLAICRDINFPVSQEKTIWSTQEIIFLGLLINTLLQLVVIPGDKRDKAVDALNRTLRSKKVKVHELQKLTGQLNFLSKAVVPGRAFTRRMYNKFSNMKQYHHIRVDSELKLDCQVWYQFLLNPCNVARPFADFEEQTVSEVINLTSDASLNQSLGFAGVFKRPGINGQMTTSWFAQKWPAKFIQKSKCSIEVAELIGTCTAVTVWADELKGRRVTIWCDNQAVVHMVNNTTSSCRKCMFLIRHLTLLCMQFGIRVFCKYISTTSNRDSDLLSRLKIAAFFQNQEHAVDADPTVLPSSLWPFPQVLWMVNT